MLTRLKVSGFKNLIDTDVSFGPFTCIAGVNGVGKSNLFDAITFLSALADHPLVEAARSVRDEHNRATDVRSLFLRLGARHVAQMSFEAEMLVPVTGQDDLGQKAKAAISFLKYTLVLEYRQEPDLAGGDRLEIIKEELDYISVGDAHKHLSFPHNLHWRKSVVAGSRRGKKFLSTEGSGDRRKIKLHQDGRAGKPREYLASQLPRTVLSSTNALESPTALLARREMQSARLLQLEPSALRNSDPFNAPVHIGVDGAHLAATLHHLARKGGGNGQSSGGQESVYARVANQLSELVDDVRGVRVDEERQRELLTLQVIDRNQNQHAARALSDGTLRFLALAILEMDPESRGLLCLEEPENGIHPERIASMLRLLKNLCVDVDEPAGKDNPLRQVIVNTHSPSVVALVEDNDLIVAEPREVVVEGKTCRAIGFSWLDNTWRAQQSPAARIVSRGALRAYLNPFAFSEPLEEVAIPAGTGKRRKRRLVKDREDLQRLLPFSSDE